MQTQSLGRRQLLGLGLAAALPQRLFAASYQRIKWADLIPGGLSYPEIVGRGRIDTENDIWVPEFDANGSVFNMALADTPVTLAGFILPLAQTAEGVTEFVLVPYVGACIHTPPPPPNQLLFVTTNAPWPQSTPWEAVLVSGRLRVQLRQTEVADIGYDMVADPDRTLSPLSGGRPASMAPIRL